MSNHPYSELFEHFQNLSKKLDVIEAILKTNTSIQISNEKDVLFTPKQLAEYWQCNPQTILKKKLKGELPFIQNGRYVRFSKKAIDKLTTVSLSKKGR